MRHRNICVVGDPDQSIYAWRGADIKNILDFEQRLPRRQGRPARAELPLDQDDPRTSRPKLIAQQHAAQGEGALDGERRRASKATLLLCQDEHDEADVGHAPASASCTTSSGYAWNQMAIFYRMNALSRVMEDALRRANVPYQIARGVEFYNRKEIKDVLAYLRVIANPSDEVSLTRIVNVPAARPRRHQRSSRCPTYAVAHGISLFEAMAAAPSKSRASRQPRAQSRPGSSSDWLVSSGSSWPRATADDSSRPWAASQRVMENVVTPQRPGSSC